MLRPLVLKTNRNAIKKIQAMKFSGQSNNVPIGFMHFS